MVIEPRKNKDGKITSYRIVVYDGHNVDGTPKREKMTWRPSAGMTEKQIEKELNRVAVEFETKVKTGLIANKVPTFAEYAEIALKTKIVEGLSPRTIGRYRELLVRINIAMGHLKINKIQTAHLNDFYKNLMEEGIRLSSEKAVPTPLLVDSIREQGISLSEIHRRTGMATSTVSSALKGKSILKENADKIAKVLGIPSDKLFVFSKDRSPLSKKTIREYHNLISTILAYAKSEKYILANPAEDAKPPRPTTKDAIYYQPEDVDRILDALDKVPLKWKSIAYLMIDTGARRGEVAGAKWANINFETGSWYIACALNYNKERGVYESLPKNNKTRHINLSPVTLALLKDFKAEQEERCIIYGDKWVETEYVFTKNNGDIMSPDSITQWFNKFSKKYGLPHIHPHALRHTAITNMIANGADVITTASQLGNSPEMIQHVYAHRQNEAIAKADSIRFGVFNRRNKEASAQNDEDTGNT